MKKKCGVHFLCFRLEKTFLDKSGQKNLVPRLLNTRNSMVMFIFFAFDHKYLSWANLLQKFKIVCSEWNLIQRVFEYAKFIGGVYFICFRLNIATFFGKFGPKSRNCQFKVKIGTYTNSNMTNSILMFIFLSWGILFLKLCSKNRNCLFKLKFRIYSHLQKMIQVGEFKWKEMKNSNYSQYPVPSPPIKNWFSQLSCWK